MPTPILIDGFEHQVAAIESFAGLGNGLWEAVDTGTLSFPAGRNGVCLRVAAAGSSVMLRKHLISNRATLVASFYIRTSTSPGGNVRLFNWQNSAFSTVLRAELTSAGLIRMESHGVSGPAINDGNWHRVDLRFSDSLNTIEWAIDGSAQTQLATALTNVLYMVFGTELTDTVTVDFDDLVLSVTEGDYPLGAHDVLYGVPTGDGTHVAGTNVIEDNAGTDIVSPNAFPLLDELPPTTANYIQQVASGSGNYAEVTFDDQPANKTIWGVEGAAALFSSNANANNGITRIVDSADNTLTDIYSGDMSETVLHYRRAIITAPAGGWDGAGYQGVKARVGFSTDIDGVPRWAALLLQYAVADVPVPDTRTLRTITSPLRW